MTVSEYNKFEEQKLLKNFTKHVQKYKIIQKMIKYKSVAAYRKLKLENVHI